MHLRLVRWRWRHASRARDEGSHGAQYTTLGRQAPDLGATVEELARAGVKFERHNFPGVDEKGIWTPPGSDTKIAWFKDPHGNILSLTQFSPRFLHKGC